MIVKPNKVQPPGNGLRCPYGCYVTFWRWYGLVAHLMDKHGYSEKKAEKVADKAIPYDPDPEPVKNERRPLTRKDVDLACIGLSEEIKRRVYEGITKQN